MRYGPAALAILAGLAFSLVTYFVFEKLEEAAIQSEFEHRVADLISAVRSRIEADTAVVHSIVSFFQSSASVERDEFHTFTQPLLAGTPGIQALEWARCVLGSEREAYERVAEREGHGDFRISERSAQGELVPATRREEYLPVLYVEPLAGNDGALGFDLASEPKRAAALAAARATGLVRATGRITLVQEKGAQSGILLLAPVYRLGDGSHRDEMGQRRASLVGFAVGVFRLKDLLASATSQWSSQDRLREGGIDLHLYDEGGTEDDRLLASYRTSDPRGPDLLSAEHEVRSGVHLAAVFDVAGREWTLVARPVESAAKSSKSWVPPAALLVGIAFTASLAAVLLLNAHRSRVQDQLVELRTAELEAAREQLRLRASEHEAAQATLHELSKIAKYLSPQVYASISTGEKKVQIASQRKKLTVFFCDIAEFTKTVDQLEPEDVTQMLNQYLTEMSRIGIQHGGTIDKYIGDGIMIFFGDPETLGGKEDALQCVKMAIAMRKRMEELQTGWEALGLRSRLRCRIGISTGYCMVGNFGSEERMDYTIIGAGVNLASRLEAAAPPGGILISHETHVLVRDEICCEEQPLLHVKGLTQPVANYEVVDVWENVVDRESVIRADLPSMKLEVDLRRLSNEDRAKVAAALQQALRRVESGQG